MKKIKILFLSLIAFVFVSCDIDDFGDLNVNPNATTTPQASYLLSNALASLPGVISSSQGQLYVQYLANSQYTSSDNYQTVRFSYNGWYLGPLADLDLVIKMNSEEETMIEAQVYGSNANQIAAAKILTSFYYLHITDRWGDIPYSEALQSDEANFLPKFDSQEAVYASIFQELKAASAMIDGGAGPEGDFLFSGDMDKWKTFANTIRLVAALRLSKADPDQGKTEFVAAMNDGVVTTNEENIFYQHLADANNQNPWYAAFLTRSDYAVSNTLIDYMQSTENGGMMDVEMDPRLPVFANGTESSQYSEYVGMTYGVSEAVAGGISNSDVSFLGDAFRGQDTPTYIYTAAQVLFSMAEAAELGWIDGSVEDYYYQAIQASLDQYGVGDSFDGFVSNSEVAFDADNALELIGNQKWVALYLNGYEAWTEWRRTGYPALEPASAALNESGKIPVRQGYPTTERDNNSENYSVVESADNLDTPVWWDK
ncbi:SusD/RagB family nutrient-binding outer membrane lipoprotein [Chondrinema litorale]|uniref:SusD/RagB family nutrient-binding outer membrane lipoprotein n=1 Tax=Chondrinema litorale TaxID=2994555 RepID=UPI0025427240|nr:SusD/RagB family nutrient-binding outer membrane lipoprotein [Chondrinema litorale]UZR94147.1 SusD/RagB family nutrient-binding outer membrane lipoprotein [Chondrinema litorale]